MIKASKLTVQLTLNDRSGELSENGGYGTKNSLADGQCLSSANHQQRSVKVSVSASWVPCTWMSCMSTRPLHFIRTPRCSEMRTARGLLHTSMPNIHSRQRLEDEYESSVIITSPTVPFKGESNRASVTRFASAAGSWELTS